MIASGRRPRAIAEAKPKTDRLDARTLREPLDAGCPPSVRRPDESPRALRGLLGRRERLVRSRGRAKHAVPAALGRKTGPPRSDRFGSKRRGWPARTQPPGHERRIAVRTPGP